jgi:hypothetical protein
MLVKDTISEDNDFSLNFNESWFYYKFNLIKGINIQVF